MMTLFSYINENIDHVKTDTRLGLISCSLLNHYSIYSRFDYYKKLGHSIRDAASCAAIDFNVTDNTVFIIKKKMEAEV
jgi:hypothetical protein